MPEMSTAVIAAAIGLSAQLAFGGPDGGPAAIAPRAIAEVEMQECATELTDAEIAQHLALEAAGAFARPYGQRSMISVPVTFHVLRRSNGTGGLPVDRQAQAMIDLDLAYAPAGIRFCKPGPTIYIDDDAMYSGITTSAAINALRRTNPVPDTINIWFVEGLRNEGGGLCGISSFTTSSTQGIVMNNSCTALPTNASTLPHEVGHYFNLYHTHETSFGCEHPNGSNCATAGDRLCDTPADPVLGTGNVSSSCVYSGAGENCAATSGFAADPRNFMSYSRKTCRDFFSQQQLDKMVATVINLRPELVNACPTCPADYDNSGGVDGDDITAFFADWQIGAGDIDGSGGVDGDDIAYFFGRWQAGC